MSGVALALVVVGVLLLFVIPWVGIAAGIVGLIPRDPLRRRDRPPRRGTERLTHC
jgi:hypothetical protein